MIHIQDMPIKLEYPVKICTFVHDRLIGSSKININGCRSFRTRPTRLIDRLNFDGMYS